MEKQLSEIGHTKDMEQKSRKTKTMSTVTKAQSSAAYFRKVTEWALGVFSCFLLLKGIHREISAEGVLSMLPKMIILFTVGISMYNWRKAILGSFLSRKEEHLFYHKTVIGIIIGLFGAISGNPWLLFFLTSRSLNTKMFMLMLVTHSVMWGSTCFIQNQAIKQIISVYPTIATVIVNVEEILSNKGMHCTYEKSRRYLLGLSLAFITFCFVVLVFFLDPEIMRILIIKPVKVEA